MGLSSVPILPLLDMYRMQIVGQTFNPKSTDINKISLKTALELFMKDSARTGTSCECCYVKKASYLTEVSHSQM